MPFEGAVGDAEFNQGLRQLRIASSGLGEKGHRVRQFTLTSTGESEHKRGADLARLEFMSFFEDCTSLVEPAELESR